MKIKSLFLSIMMAIGLLGASIVSADTVVHNSQSFQQSYFIKAHNSHWQHRHNYNQWQRQQKRLNRQHKRWQRQYNRWQRQQQKHYYQNNRPCPAIYPRPAYC